MTQGSASKAPDAIGTEMGGLRVRLFARKLDQWWLLALPVFLFLGVFFVYPTSIILLRAFTEFDAPQQGGLDNLAWFLGGAANRTILVRTFVVAASSTVLTSLIAFPYAYLMTLVGDRLRTAMLGIVLISMFFGILLRNFAWVVLLQYQGPLNDLLELAGMRRIRFLGSMPAVLMGMTHVLFPYMLLPLYSVLRGIDRRLVLAAQSLGATPQRAFWQVYVPLSTPGFVAGSLLVFVLALGFFITPAMLGSQQQSLLSQLMFTQFDKTAAFGRAGAMALVLIVAATAFVVVGNAISRKNRAYETSA
jgi:putative spermidine/putrescine transport system permease protein